MNYGQENNFNPKVQCPHCLKFNNVHISGWGRHGINSRTKDCKHCGRTYVVIINVVTSPALECSVENYMSLYKDLKKRLRLALVDKARYMQEIAYMRFLIRQMEDNYPGVLIPKIEGLIPGVN